MADDANQGHPAGHTPPETPAPALDGADPAELIAGLDDVDATDVLAMAAELVAAPRRARGRPAGAGNRKNADMIAYLAAKGHRDPWVTLSLIQTADTLELAELLGKPAFDKQGVPIIRDGKLVNVRADPLAVLAIQRQAADALMPYHHSKKPQQLDLVIPMQRPLMVIEQMNVAISGDASAFMSAGIDRSEKANEINGDAVRQSPAMPHEKPST